MTGDPRKGTQRRAALGELCQASAWFDLVGITL